MDQPENDAAKKSEEAAKNQDPLTGERGSHPIGTGVGTAGGGLAGAAIGAAIGGPLGAAVGAVVGGIAGAYGGHGVAEAVNPSAEEKYWRENHPTQAWAEKDTPYEHYAPAYKTGYEAAIKYAGKHYDEIEHEVARDYEQNETLAIPWDRARPAVKAAWHRVSGVTGPRDSDRGMRGGI